MVAEAFAGAGDEGDEGGGGGDGGVVGWGEVDAVVGGDRRLIPTFWVRGEVC